ncbi:carboxypeptidase-like regulatory domain-containing protein [Polynucleobacter sp. CS-Odin-A6]|uniref:carboxypeptidase-like regulatory domain-containing protein n=1 Tax=Polynucleobacter sp. CS-Odin-A6 TaxID=2689106 RepID=UPI001C0BC6A5|nr:carboxypeptidase-like regulatory domain-containing protein [Polynucleobacter sp. CS-Odin-A6]MBU3620481.1 carboxypeptidase regulatory-like domain-containing protein [Polynucleobacter sp. CS-Odin-A6]
MNYFIKSLLTATYCIFCSVVFAQIPDTQYSQGISYVSGGVGEGESQAILDEAQRWPLLLELSQLERGRGVWIFGATIQILNTQNQIIFDAQANGPYILINLPVGNYQIAATYQGVVQKKSVNIKSTASHKINLFWQ